MKKLIGHIFIQFLIIAFVGLGLSQAGGQDCSAGCPHCETAAMVSCCDDMAPVSGHDRPDMPGQQFVSQSITQSASQGCSNAEVCLSTPGHLDIAGGPSSHKLNSGAISSAPVFSALHSYAFRDLSAVPYSSLTLKSSPIYTINCSFLI